MGLEFLPGGRVIADIMSDLTWKQVLQILSETDSKFLQTQEAKWQMGTADAKELREADVVTWRGTSYFATAPHAEWQNDLELYILTPEQFVQFSLSRKPGQRFTGFGRRHIADLGAAVKLELMPKQLPEITITPRDSAWWSEEVAEREDAQREEVRQLVARRAEQLQALSQLTMADEAVAEAARTAADAAVSAYEQREAAWQAYLTAFAAQYSGSYGPAEPAAQ